MAEGEEAKIKATFKVCAPYHSHILLCGLTGRQPVPNTCFLDNQENLRVWPVLLATLGSLPRQYSTSHPTPAFPTDTANAPTNTNQQTQF